MSYTSNIMDRQPAHLVTYWPGNEASGTTAQDASGNDFDATYNNVTLGQTGVGDGSTAPDYNGTTSYTNIYSAGMAAAFNGASGTLAAFAKTTTGAWNAASARRVVTIQSNGLNRVILQKNVANTFFYFYQAGGVTQSYNKTSMTTQDWFHVCMTWDKAADQVRMYLNGALLSTQTGMGTYAAIQPNADVSTVGASRSISPNNYWLGGIAHVALWDVALTPDEVRLIATVFGAVEPIPSHTIYVPKKDRTVYVPRKDRTVYA